MPRKFKQDWDNNQLVIVQREFTGRGLLARLTRGDSSTRGGVCQILPNGQLTPGFDPHKSTIPYVAVNNTSEGTTKQQGAEYQSVTSAEVVYAGIFDDDLPEISIEPLDQPLWFVLEVFNFESEENFKALQVGTLLTAAYSLSGGVSYPEDAAGLWSVVPNAADIPAGNVLPVIGVVREISDRFVLVRSRAVTISGVERAPDGYEPFPQAEYVETPGAGPEPFGWDADLGWDEELDWDTEV